MNSEQLSTSGIRIVDIEPPICRSYKNKCYKILVPPSEYKSVIIPNPHKEEDRERQTIQYSVYCPDSKVKVNLVNVNDDIKFNVKTSEERHQLILYVEIKLHSEFI